MNAIPPDPSSERQTVELTCRQCLHTSSLSVGSFERTIMCPRCGAAQPIPGTILPRDSIPPRVTSPFKMPGKPGPVEELDIVLLDDTTAEPAGGAAAASATLADLAPDVMSVRRSLSAGRMIRLRGACLTGW